MEAFWELSTERQFIVPIFEAAGIIQGVPKALRIPYSVIRAWAKEQDYTPDEEALFVKAIRAMDDEFLLVINHTGDAPLPPVDIPVEKPPKARMTKEEYRRKGNPARDSFRQQFVRQHTPDAAEE